MIKLKNTLVDKEKHNRTSSESQLKNSKIRERLLASTENINLKKSYKKQGH